MFDNTYNVWQFIAQIVVFGLTLGLGWFIALFLWRPLNGLSTRLEKIGWADTLLSFIHKLLWPLSVGVLNSITVTVFRQLDWPNYFLADTVPIIIMLWLGYHLIDTLLHANLSEVGANVWGRQVLLPTFIFFVALYLFRLQKYFLEYPLGYGQNINVGSLLTGVAIIIAVLFVARAVWHYLAEQFLPSADAEPALAHAIATLVAYSIVFLGGLGGLTVIGFDLATLTVIAGGLSIGLGFGLQQIVSNFVSGFILMFERSIGPGDVIELGGALGSVKTIGIRRMIIKTPENKEITIPNSHFLSDVMTNLTRDTPVTRVAIDVGVSYNSNPREVEQALLESSQHPSVLIDPQPTVFFQGFGDNSLNFTLFVWTDNPFKIPALSSDLRYNIWDELAYRNIEMPFPQRDIHIRSGWPVKAADDDQ
ncbi:mechanosensitive ion channel [Anaerolineales bacterium HSG6]|nr:mechanosensitive ion channel [Anaerolineales bacterium HSG6]MDM8532393.1 mechanosensitive ion channel [Anaerolineales bacterium HSG25]